MTAITQRRATLFGGHDAVRVERTPGRFAARCETDELPWRTRDLARLGWLSAIGLLGVLVCWYGISGENTLSVQIGWLVGAIGSLVLAGIGAVGWLLTGLRAVHYEARGVAAVVRNGQPTEASNTTFELAAVPVDGFVIGAAMTRAHRADCPHVHGKSVALISEADIARRDLRRCGVCCS